MEYDKQHNLQVEILDLWFKLHTIVLYVLTTKQKKWPLTVDYTVLPPYENGRENKGGQDNENKKDTTNEILS